MEQKHRLPGMARLRERWNAAIRWRIAEAVEPLRGELARTHELAAWTANEMERLQPHVAALDARLEDLRVALADIRLVSEDGDTDRARTVLDEIRREHAVVRERLSGISLYEERIRRLEDS